MAQTFFANKTACDPKQESDTQAILSPCFTQILLMSDVLNTADFKAWLHQKLPNPTVILNSSCCNLETKGLRGFGVAPSRLLALSRIKTLLPESQIWATAYDSQLRRTMSNVILWKDNPVAVPWTAPLNILALTEELN